MWVNEFTVIFGNSVIFVPYEKLHVPKYHEWMKSEELQILTASEPLTLEKEYDMQESWRRDDDKCTFIILDKNLYQADGNEVEAMIGDTNLFLSFDENKKTAEIEIMIAEHSARGQGRGREAVKMMLRYGAEILNISKFEAKISIDNIISVKLFTSLGFKKVRECKIFKEVTMEALVNDDWLNWLRRETLSYHIKTRKDV